MSTTFPTTKQSIPNPTSTDLLENADNTLDHDYQHSTINDTIEALQDKVGIDGSAVTTSHDYKLSGVTGSDKAVSKTGTETLINKTLTAPQINFGSDSNGDLIIRNGSGVTSRLAIGSTDQILAVQSGIPTWVTNPAVSDASTTVKGSVEIATTAEITAGTATGGTGAVLVVPASAVGTAGASKLVQYDATGKLPAVDGSQLTNMVNPSVFASGSTTKDATDSSTTQNIAHGLGKVPKFIRIRAFIASTTTLGAVRESFTLYNGTTQTSMCYLDSGTNNNAYSTAGFDLSNAVNSPGTNRQRGVTTVDATNIVLTWTKTGSPTGTYTLIWEAYG